MYWENVKSSYFNYQEWYKHLYDSMNDKDIFIEIGTWAGASCLFFAEMIKNGEKDIEFYTIDIFKGMFYDGGEKIDVYQYFLSVREPLKEYINIIRANSQIKKTADKFADKSIAAIFIDGDHSPEGIQKDLDNWYPKIKDGGIISGHDYIWGGMGVKPIVDVFSEFKVTKYHKGDVWHYIK